MRSILSVIILLLGSTLFAQGYQETYDQECSCWVIKNHYDDGTLSAIHHENASRQKHGELLQYNSNGDLLRKEIWKNGKLDGTSVQYHPNGAVYLESYFDNGKKIGTWVFRDVDGTPTQEISYNGQGSDGTYAYYYAGVKYAEQIIEKGLLVTTNVLNQEVYEQVQSESATQTKPQ